MVIISGIQDPTDDSKKPPLLAVGALLSFPPFDVKGWKAGDLKSKMHIAALSCKTSASNLAIMHSHLRSCVTVALSLPLMPQGSSTALVPRQ